MSLLQDILASIPDVVSNRTNFLGIIRQIAEAIKETLDAVNLVASNNEAEIASEAEVRSGCAFCGMGSESTCCSLQDVL